MADHRDSGCKECVFVSELKDIIYHVRLADYEQIRRPVLAGLFTSKDWIGHAPFYVFRCPFCREKSIDYAHGYTGGGFLYFRCSNGCQVLIKDREIYEKLEIPVPSPLLSWKERRRITKIKRLMEQLDKF